MTELFINPTQSEITKILRAHPLLKLREKVVQAFVVGSFAKEQLGLGKTHAESDVDILLEVIEQPGQPAGYTDKDLEDSYRNALRGYFMKNNIRGKMDSVHPQWMGRRVDVYMTYNASTETRPMIKLAVNEKEVNRLASTSSETAVTRDRMRG